MLTILGSNPVAVTKPHQPLNIGVFYKGRLVLVNFGTAIIRNVTIGAEGLEPLGRVEFYLDGELVKVDDTPPYEWEWKTRYFVPRKHTIDAAAYRLNGEYGGKYSIKVWKILWVKGLTIIFVILIKGMDWYEKSKRFEINARKAFEMELYDIVCFSCQQAVELYLKVK